MIQIAVLGYGTVGSGVVEVINKNQKEVSKKAGVGIAVKYILDLRDFPGDPMEKCVVHDYDVILNDPEVKIICETMGGVEPAYTFSKKALLAGKSVCTSNKELVANHGPELISIAKANNCNYLFEASVGGGIPIIRPLNSSLTPERIDGITGILNGTTNYMLTKMDEDGVDYAQVLAEAQQKGYAERNPEADVEGYDACRKIAILSSLVYGKTVRYEDIYTEGITKISKEDFLYAKAMKRSIKLLAMSKDMDGSCFAMVAPFMIRSDNPLYCVKDVFNAVCVHGNMLGTTMYYGRGAGKLPTASAVVSDIIDCAKHQGKFIFCFWDQEKVTLSSKEEMCWKFFVRVKGDKDSCGLMKAFGETEMINIPECQDEFAFITDEISEKEFEERIKEVSGVITRIRMND
ncbi:MAG: homoserine dehydrogenase [Lachnospiraceae bacterium]|nr:homoserine dehydrogenase [Lachnospiraceae bacterium]